MIVGSIDDVSNFIAKGHHKCTPKQAAQIIVEISSKVKVYAKQDTFGDASKIAERAMNEVLSKHPSVPLCGVTSKKNLAKQAHRVRGQTMPKIPGKDDLLTFDLRTDQLPEDFFRWDIKVTKGTDVRRHVFFATEMQMTYLALATECRIDSTFTMVAPPFTQLFSIHSSVNLGGNVKQYVLGFVLMSGKRREDYQQVFEEIIKTLEHEKGLTVNVKSFLLDYEVACWQALREVFGETVKICGCWFHLSQSVIRRVHNKDLMHAYYKKGALHKLIKQLTVLPLLNADMISAVFKHMVGKVCAAFQYSEDDFYDSEKRKAK